MVHCAVNLPVVQSGIMPSPFFTAKTTNDAKEKRPARAATCAIPDTRNVIWRETLTVEMTIEEAENGAGLFLSIIDAKTKKYLGKCIMPVDLLIFGEQYNFRLNFRDDESFLLLSLMLENHPYNEVSLFTRVPEMHHISIYLKGFRTQLHQETMMLALLYCVDDGNDYEQHMHRRNSHPVYHPALPFNELPIDDPDSFSELPVSMFKVAAASEWSVQPIWNQTFDFNILRDDFLKPNSALVMEFYRLESPEPDELVPRGHSVVYTGASVFFLSQLSSRGGSGDIRAFNSVSVTLTSEANKKFGTSADALTVSMNAAVWDSEHFIAYLQAEEDEQEHLEFQSQEDDIREENLDAVDGNTTAAEESAAESAGEGEQPVSAEYARSGSESQEKSDEEFAHSADDDDHRVVLEADASIPASATASDSEVEHEYSHEKFDQSVENSPPPPVSEPPESPHVSQAMTAMIQQLQQQLEDLQHEQQEQHERYKASIDRQQQLERRLADKEQQLAEVEAALQECEPAMVEAETELQAKEKALADADRTIARHVAALADRDGQLAAARVELESVRRALGNAKSENERMQAQLRTLQQQLQDHEQLQQQLQQLQQLQLQQSESPPAAGSRRPASGNGVAEQQLAAAQAQTAQLKEENKALGNRVQQLKDEVARLQAWQREHGAQTPNPLASSGVAAVDPESEEVRERLTKLEVKLQKREKQLAKSREIETRYSDLQRAHTQQGRFVQTLQDEIVSLRKFKKTALKQEEVIEAFERLLSQASYRRPGQPDFRPPRLPGVPTSPRQLMEAEQSLNRSGSSGLPDTDNVKRQPVRHGSSGSYRKPSPHLVPLAEQPIFGGTP
eukprot:TRINITY_DN14327_c0_g1_i1.p1 TRINITY_DN14327_c0_g1~~TRINITY_DN14327_c0_g1_i1.p1  ORF type:complete len:951 (-),score=372.49 TRINITY_DN14327_c0_g1_i1:768-3311(-)